MSVLSTRSYPAAGVRIVPATCGAGRLGYITFLVLIPAFIGYCISQSVGFTNMLKSPSMHWWLSGYVLVAGAAVIYLGAMKLEIREDAISYTNLFHGTNLIFFTEISLAVLYIDPNPPNRWMQTPTTWADSRLVGKLMITPKPETGKPALKIPLDYFPDEAKEQFAYVLKPQEWDVRAVATDIIQE